jgi:hypothetical protein
VYKPWSTLVKDLETEGFLTSEVTFNTDYGNMYVKFSNYDINALHNRFHDTNTGETSISFKIGAFVAGSTDQGAGATVDDLETVEIKFTLIETDTQTNCMENVLTVTDLTLDQDQRVIEPITLSTGGTKSDYVIKGNKVRSSKGDDCPTTTIVEFYDYSTGKYVEQRQSEYIGIEVVNKLEITVKYDQAWLINTAAGKYFEMMDVDTEIRRLIPDEIYIIGNFKTIDETTGEAVYDSFEITIVSSGETEADLCAAKFAGLSFLEGSELTVPRTYEVTDANEVKSIYIPTTLDGVDALGDCAD